MASLNQPNIVLTGLAGTGKRAVAQRLASHTGRELVDIEAEIAAKYGETDPDDERTTQIEREIVSTLAPRRGLIIATGDKTMLDQENVVALLGAEVFTMTASAKEISKSLESSDTALSPDQIEQLLDERAEAYARFTSVDTTGKTVEEVIEALRDAGASIPRDIEAEVASQTRDNVTRVFTIIIAAALAVLVVLIFLVLTF